MGKLFIALHQVNSYMFNFQNDTLTFYSGYKPSDLTDLVGKLNKLISTSSKYVTIKNKYSDRYV